MLCLCLWKFVFVDFSFCGVLYLSFLAVFFCGVNPLTGFGELLSSLCICLFSCVFVEFFYLNVYLYFVCVFVFLIWSKHPLTGDSIVLLRAELKSGDGVRQAAYDKGRSSIRMSIWSPQ